MQSSRSRKLTIDIDRVNDNEDSFYSETDTDQFGSSKGCQPVISTRYQLINFDMELPTDDASTSHVVKPNRYMATKETSFTDYSPVITRNKKECCNIDSHKNAGFFVEDIKRKFLVEHNLTMDQFMNLIKLNDQVVTALNHLSEVDERVK